MKKALILGGTGAMGEYLVDIISENNTWDVFVTSRNERNDRKNIHYIKGNARDRQFMNQLLTGNRYDVIVDFMNYGYDEFKECYNELLEATDNYVFLSSSRVYSNSDVPISENTPRLLDVTKDIAFLSTQRYALRKARQEDMLLFSGKNNYTIIRPYITYSNRRLQLGVYEKEQWLYRLLNDKPLIIRGDILEKKTTLTYGYDVSLVLSKVMGSSPLGKAVHIMSEETMTWGSILDLYRSVIRDELGKDIVVYTTNNMSEIEELFEGGYNTVYDRLFDRSFDNSFAEKNYGHVDYMKMSVGLNKCLREFIADWKEQGNRIFLPIMWEYEALMDKMLCIYSPPTNVNEECIAKYNKIIKETSLAHVKDYPLSSLF